VKFLDRTGLDRRASLAQHEIRRRRHTSENGRCDLRPRNHVCISHPTPSGHCRVRAARHARKVKNWENFNKTALCDFPCWQKSYNANSKLAMSDGKSGKSAQSFRSIWVMTRPELLESVLEAVLRKIFTQLEKSNATPTLPNLQSTTPYQTNYLLRM